MTGIIDSEVAKLLRKRQERLDKLLAEEALSREEFEAVLTGRMDVHSHSVRKGKGFVLELMLQNYDVKNHPTLGTGESGILYPGRATLIVADQLTGLDPRRNEVVYMAYQG